MPKKKSSKAPPTPPEYASEAYNIVTATGSYTKKMPDGNRICFAAPTWYPPRSQEERDLLEEDFENQGPEFVVSKKATRMEKLGGGWVVRVDHDAELIANAYHAVAPLEPGEEEEEEEEGA